jgi:Transposase DDE domain
MPLSVAELHATLHDLFYDTARQLAKDTGFCRRQRLLTGPVFAQAVVFSLLEKPACSLEDFADFAAEHLGVEVTAKAFDERFTQAAACLLRALFLESFQRCFTARPAPLPLLRRFNGVYLRDATLIGLPGCLAEWFPGRKGRGGKPSAAVKLVLEMEVRTGLLTEAEVLPGLANEKTAALADKPLPAGALLLEDMGFLAGERLQGYAEQGVYVLARVPAWTAFFEPKGQGFRRLDVLKWLRRATGEQLQRRVYVFHKQKLALRLLATRVPPEVAEQRRAQARRDARQRGRPVSQRKLDLCDWNILVTNAPPALLTAAEAGAVRRVRWQIELLFKVFKSEGGIERTQARDRWRVLAELFAKLLGMAVQHWALLCAGYVVLRHSGRRLARRVRRRVGALLRSLRSAARLGRLIDRLSRELRRCAIQKRTKQPSTFDRLAALDDEFVHQEQAA